MEMPILLSWAGGRRKLRVFIISHCSIGGTLVLRDHRPSDQVVLFRENLSPVIHFEILH
jgi:hypothetical protein